MAQNGELIETGCARNLPGRIPAASQRPGFRS
jgi:hypothetical protein